MRTKAIPLLITILLCSYAFSWIEFDDRKSVGSALTGRGESDPFYSIIGEMELRDFVQQIGSTGNGSVDNPMIIENISLNSYEGWCGLYISDAELYLKIVNCTFSNISKDFGSDGEYGIGISIARCRNVTIKDNIISNCSSYGIAVSNCLNISILGTVFHGDGDAGLFVSYTIFNTVANNSFVGGLDYGIFFDKYSSPSGLITKNTFSGCGIYLDPYSYLIQDFRKITDSNLINGKPMKVEQDMTNGTISGDAGQLIMINCSGIAVDGLNMSNCSVGITLIDCQNISISNCSISRCISGVSGRFTDSQISGSEVIQNTYGFDIIGDNNAITYCDIAENELGFTCWGIHCQIRGNNFYGNKIGVKSTIDTGHWNISENIFRDHLEDAVSLMDYMGGADSGYSNILNNRFFDNHGSGINLLQTAYIHVFNNIFRGGGTGIVVYSWESRFENNTFTGLDEQSILISYCPDCVFKNNNMSGSGIKHLTIGWHYYEPDGIIIDQSNTLDGRPIYHSINEINTTIDYDYGQIILLACYNISIQDHTVSNRSDFIQISNGIDVRITNNSFVNSGIDVVFSTEISFTNNQIQGTWIFMEGVEVEFRYNNIDGFCFIPWRYFYPSEIDLDKNYWGDYLERYPDHTVNDGRCWNHPYEISHWNAVDYHPLIYPFDYTGPRSPVFVEDLTPDHAEAGEDLNFSVVIGDFHGIRKAHVELRFSKTDHNITLNMSDNDTWYAHLSVPLINDSIWYRYQAGNIPGSWNQTDWRPVKIVDTHPPTIEDLSAPYATTGDPYMIRIGAEDNLPIDYIRIAYWYAEAQNETIRYYYNNSAELVVPISGSSLEPIRYQATVRELLGNYFSSETRKIPVLDNDPPIVGGLVDFSVQEGEEFNLNGSRCWDNIGIVNYTWIITGPDVPIIKYGIQPELVLNQEGVYLINLTISDDAGNLDENAFRIYVKPGPVNDTEDPVDPLPEYLQVPVGPVIDTNGNIISGAEINVSYRGTIISAISNEAGEATILVPRSWLGSNLKVEIRKDGYYPSTLEIPFVDSMSLYGSIDPLVPIPVEEPEEDDDLDIRYLIIPLLLVLALTVLAGYFVKVKGFPGYTKDEE